MPCPSVSRLRFREATARRPYRMPFSIKVGDGSLPLPAVLSRTLTLTLTLLVTLTLGTEARADRLLDPQFLLCVAFAHQAFHLYLLWCIGNPDGIAVAAQFRFEQLNRFYNNDRLAGALDEDIYRLTDKGMDDALQLFQRILVSKDKMTELGPVDLSVRVEQPFAEGI